MSLKTAINFRFLINQLTQTETHQFINELLDPNIIITALFNHILEESTHKQFNGDHINDIISNIILSRKKKPKPTIPIQTIQLNQLPKRLIGVISSFITQKDYIHFSQNNRWIYLGCNTPNLLQELNLIKITN
eukprot:230625_1